VVVFYIWVQYGVKCYRTFPCGHYHQRPQGFVVDLTCYCVKETPTDHTIGH